MLADQTEIILDLREKLVKASQHREQLQDSLIEVEHLLDSSESQRKDAADNLDRKCRREMQLTSKIKSLEDVNLKLKQTVEMQSEDSSSSDSDGGIEEEEAEEEEEERSAEGEGEDEVDEGKEESVEGRIEAYIVAKHNAQAIAKRLRSRDCELGIADVAYRDGCRASSQTSHPTHLTKQTLSPSSPSSSSPSSASGLRKQLRLSSRKELKGRIVQLTASHLSLEASKKAKEDLIKAFRVTIEEQKDEILCCTTAAKEAKRELEDTAKKLLCKENENIRVAHSVVSKCTCVYRFMHACCHHNSIPILSILLCSALFYFILFYSVLLYSTYSTLLYSILLCSILIYILYTDQPLTHNYAFPHFTPLRNRLHSFVFLVLSSLLPSETMCSLCFFSFLLVLEIRTSVRLFSSLSFCHRLLLYFFLKLCHTVASLFFRSCLHFFLFLLLLYTV